jgi:trehalose 6-phosphate phosphatase
MTSLPQPATPEGRIGLDALLADPRHALVAADFDGTLAPIVDRPGDARAHPGAVPALTALAGAVATPAVQAARRALPGVLREAGAPDGSWIEDKAHAVAVHTRGTADPEAALRRLRGPLGELAAGLGLTAEPGRFVIELRPPGVDKGTALTGLAAERAARSVLFCGDDLGDLPAFAAVRSLRAGGIPGCAVASASAESPQVAAEADLVVAGPGGIVALLAAIAGQLGSGQLGPAS